MSAFALDYSGPAVACDFPGCVLDSFHAGDHELAPTKNHFEAFRPSREISEVGKRALDAGVAVKVKKGVEYIYVNDATFSYLTGERQSIEVPLSCRCPQREYPHELSVHFNLRSESYNPKLRLRWPWSLCLSLREEPSTERKVQP